MRSNARQRPPKLKLTRCVGYAATVDAAAVTALTVCSTSACVRRGRIGSNSCAHPALGRGTVIAGVREVRRLGGKACDDVPSHVRSPIAVPHDARRYPPGVHHLTGNDLTGNGRFPQPFRTAPHAVAREFTHSHIPPP